MTTSLRDIPGARPDPNRRRRRPRPQPVGYRPQILTDPRAGLDRGPRRQSLFRDRRRPDVFLLVLCLGALVFVGYLGKAAWDANRVDVVVAGFVDDSNLNTVAASTFDLDVAISPPERVALARVFFNDRDVTGLVSTSEGRIQWEPGGEELVEGEHEIQVVVPKTFMGEAVVSRSFTVDGTPPRIEVPTLLPAAAADEAVTIEGRVDPDALLLVDGERVKHDDGHFTLHYDHPPATPVVLAATDATGNAATTQVIAPIRHPGMRAVHVTAAAWAHDELRQGVLDLIDQGRIDTVQLDIKDESGDIGYTSKVPLAQEIGSSKGHYDLEDAVEELHGRGVRIVGRMVVFRDPVLADHAWENGKHDWVVQTTDGQRHPAYGQAFANFAHPDVWQYNFDVAVEAVDAGFDDILWDYIRRPEGDLDGMVVEGMEGTPEDEIVEFLATSHPLLRERGAYQGASVFGIAAARPAPVAQDIPRIARHVDYISPMVYPSLWVSGEYRVPDPIRMPREIVRASLADFQEKIEGTGTVLYPWLQDFALYGVRYDGDDVRAQICGAADLGIDGFLMWAPNVRYHGDGLDVGAPRCD